MPAPVFRPAECAIAELALVLLLGRSTAGLPGCRLSARHCCCRSGQYVGVCVVVKRYSSASRHVSMTDSVAWMIVGELCCMQLGSVAFSGGVDGVTERATL
jgi:hypothetical protein